MASIIPGYEYDIFISYRQKDNKYDGWVTEFVDNLKRELEATFKEEVSLYFDVNPHDGLLETHDVDASLHEKLKCLVFIPIISRTYCDPKSFAWDHEFKAFVDSASQDQFGLMIKLPNGNVSGRVLPVRIHDVDDEDIELCESVMGSALRGVEFIYKSAGVNRPLRAKEEKPHDNLNNTIYRDQINKVANAINEVIRGIGKADTLKYSEKIPIRKPLETIRKKERIRDRKGDIKIGEEGKISRPKRVLIMHNWGVRIGMILAVLLTVILWYIWPFLFKPQIISRNFESSVAVLEFDDISDAQGFENFAKGATNDLVSRLARLQNLKVVPVNETLKYKLLKNATSAICKDNDVKMILQGSVKVESGNITMNAELIDGEKDVVIWKQNKADKLENTLNIQNELVSEAARAINVKYSGYEIQKQMEMRPTKNFKAYELFLKGNEELTKWTYNGLFESLVYYGRALGIDQDFIDARANSALANLLISYFYEHDKNIIENIKKDARKALSLEKENETALMSMEGYYIMKISSGQKLGILEYRDMIKKLKSLTTKNPSSPMALFGMAEYYRLFKKNLLKASEYLRQALTQCERILQSEPSNGIILGIAAQSAGILGQIEFKTGNFSEAIKKTEYSIRLVPGISRTYTQLSDFYLSTEQPLKARAVLDQAIANVINASDRGYIALIQGRNSMVDGKYKEAEQYWAHVMTDLREPKEPDYDYALLYRYVMLYKLGNAMAADSIIFDRLKTRGINSWPEPIAHFFAGGLKEDELINLAKRGWQKCEAFFFLGEKDLITGNLVEAKKHFEDCINTKENNYLEYDMSQAELNRAFTQVQ